MESLAKDGDLGDGVHQVAQLRGQLTPNSHFFTLHCLLWRNRPGLANKQAMADTVGKEVQFTNDLIANRRARLNRVSMLSNSDITEACAQAFLLARKL